MPRVPDLVADLLHQMDHRLLAGWYQAVSVPAARVRRHLRAAHRPFIDRDSDQLPSLEELDQTARWLIAQSSSHVSAFGGVAGLAGLVSVPPEAAATAVAGIRLGQRLAVVYGFDPETDRGRMALWRALAAGFQVDLPERGPMGTRASDLPAVLAPGWVSPRTVGSALAARILRRAVGMVVGPTRALPVWGAGDGARGGKRRIDDIGERMRRVLRQLADAPVGRAAVEDAEEVDG